MSTEFFNDQWRIPNNKNQNKVSNYSIDSTLTTGVNLGSRLGTWPRAMNTPWTISAWIYIPEGTSVPSGSIYNSFVQSGSLYSGIRLTVGVSSVDGIVVQARKQNIRLSRYSIVNTTFNSPTGLQRGQWHHIVCADDGIGYRSPSYEEGTNANSRGWRFYINNVVSATHIVGNPSLQPLGDVINDIAGDIYIADTDNVIVSEIAFYPYYLSASQVNTLYGSGTAMGNPMSLTPQPLNYWKLTDSAYNGANYLVPNSSLDGYIFNFDNQYAQTQSNTPSILNGATSFSISAWVKFNTVSSGPTTYQQPIIGNWESGSTQYLLRWINNGGNPRVDFYLNDGTTSYIAKFENFTPVVDTWYSVTGVWDGSNLRVYVNRSPGADVAFSGTLNTSSNSDKIGTYSTNAHLLEGSVLNLGIWKNTALTAAQVQEIFGPYVGKRLIDLVDDFSGPDPTVYYKLDGEDDTFDGSTGNWTINDSIGNRDAVSVGMNQSNLIQDDKGFVKSSVYGYSPYALDFDGVDDYLDCGNDSSLSPTSQLSVSAWVNNTGAGSGTFPTIISNNSSSANNGGFALVKNSNKWKFYLDTTGSSGWAIAESNGTVVSNSWQHLCATWDGSTIIMYLNGQAQTTTASASQIVYSADTETIIGEYAAGYFQGSISNVATWDVALTSTEITEVYNKGVPSNLNTFSGTAPTAWWQLGSNSSFNSSTWTCLDEIGTNNAVSGANMANDDITNGPGYTGMGIGDSAIKIIGDAPYSSANGLSENMDVLDRVTDTPS